MGYWVERMGLVRVISRFFVIFYGVFFNFRIVGFRKYGFFISVIFVEGERGCYGLVILVMGKRLVMV